jgi:hypothetical protein
MQNLGAESSWKGVALKTGNRPNIKKGHREVGYQDGRWMELAQDLVQWWALESVTSHLTQ